MGPFSPKNVFVHPSIAAHQIQGKLCGSEVSSMWNECFLVFGFFFSFLWLFHNFKMLVNGTEILE